MHIDQALEDEWQDANRYSSILRVEVGGVAMLVGGDAPLLSWSELPKAELEAAAFRIPHHGGALDDGGIPNGWHVHRLYKEVDAKTALVSVGTNNAHGHPNENWIDPVARGACRLLCTQVTARCHPALEVVRDDGSTRRDADEIDARRKQIITKQNQWVEPQHRHLTDRRRQVAKRLLEVPCAGTVVVKLRFNGDVDVLPTAGGGHEQVVDDWARPLCRAEDE